jgi:hypothetical protein
MKYRLLFLPMFGLLASGAAALQPASSTIKGDYVEARSASVFAGACHYNSEYMTSGRDAIMAWNITGGSFNGTSLAGVKVVAIVTADDNLADDSFLHRSVIAVDSAATSAQASAAVDALKAQCGKSLGEIVSIERTPVSFADHDRQYTVSAAGFATLSTQAMPNDECCKAPSDVWYTPLSPIVGRKVGYTTDATCLDTTLGDRWDRHAENSAFYGPFSF